MSHVQLADVFKLEMYKTINSRRPLDISFRSQNMYYYCSLPESNTILQNVKLACESERPRFLLIALRNNSNQFIHCDLTDVKVHLNSESYTYEDLNFKFDKNQFTLLYHMYSRFQEITQLLLKRYSFKIIAPIIVQDVTYKN